MIVDLKTGRDLGTVVQLLDRHLGGRKQLLTALAQEHRRGPVEWRKAGLTVFEARQEERLVAENGKARLAQVPLLRRLLFVGIAEVEDLVAQLANPFIERVSSRGGGS